MIEPQKSTTTVRIWRHYRNIGVVPGWNLKRFNRLCGMLNVTPEELGALCALRESYLASCIKRERFSPPVSLHLALIEGAFLEVKCGRKTEPIVPVNFLQK